MWITEMAAAAMLMPLARSILQEEGVKPLESNFGKALMIATAWGPVVGGVGTPAGSGSNTLAVSFLKEMAGVDLSFVDWMVFGIPCVILLIYPTWIIILKFFKPEMTHLKKTKEELMEEFKDQPKMNHEQGVTIFLFLLTILLWVTSPILEKILGMSIPISMPVVLTGCLFFFPGMSGIKWKEIEKDISWSGIILVVTGIALGMMLYNTGAAMWVSSALLGGIGNVPMLVQIFAIIIIVSLLKIVFSSNTVTGTIIIPIIIAMAETLGRSPLAVTMPAAITSSLAFILVTSSPTNVIPYSAGYFSIKDMAKAGVVLTVVASLILSIALYFIGKFTGLY
jgi:sodium-dependent dicarboxylate transporter 2/3/5